MVFAIVTGESYTMAHRRLRRVLATLKTRPGCCLRTHFKKSINLGDCLSDSTFAKPLASSLFVKLA